MCLNRLVAVVCSLLVFPVLSNGKSEGSIFHELRNALSSRKLVAGVNLKTGEIVGTGVCEGGDSAYERARMAAVADVVSQLNVSSFSSSRFVLSSDDLASSSEVLAVVCNGYLIGGEEVVRIVRRTHDGESVAVAVLWSIAKQKHAMSALTNLDGNTDEIITELRKCCDLERRTGPVLWTCSSGRRRFLGIAACKVTGTTPGALRSAMRLAKVKAQKNLAEHFRRVVTDERHLREDVIEKQSAPTSLPIALNSFLHVLGFQTRGTLGVGKKTLTSSDYGVSEILSEIKTVDNEKYAISVCCLTTKDMVVIEQ